MNYLIAHLVGDYLLQNDWMAQGKYATVYVFGLDLVADAFNRDATLFSGPIQLCSMVHEVDRSKRVCKASDGSLERDCG